MATLKIRVNPGASRNQIQGWMGDRLKVRVRAQPEKGKANASTIELLSSKLKVPKSAFKIVSGTTSQEKQIAIEGISDSDCLKRLGVSL